MNITKRANRLIMPNNSAEDRTEKTSQILYKETLYKDVQ